MDCSSSAGLEPLQTDLCDTGMASTRVHLGTIRRYYDGLGAQMLRCGNPDRMGYIAYRCCRCGEGSHRVAMELSIIAVPTRCESLCGQLGQAR